MRHPFFVAAWFDPYLVAVVEDSYGEYNRCDDEQRNKRVFLALSNYPGYCSVAGTRRIEEADVRLDLAAL